MGPGRGRSFARPKSSSFEPVLVNMMFAGLMSRWTMPCAMRFVERVGNLGGDRQRLVERQRPSFQPRGQSLALEMRHDEIVRAIDAANVVDAADVRMVQRGDRTRLALEASPRIGVAGDFTREDFDGNRAIETSIVGFVDLAHAAGAQRADDFIRTEPNAGVEGHARLSLLGFLCAVIIVAPWLVAGGYAYQGGEITRSISASAQSRVRRIRVSSPPDDRMPNLCHQRVILATTHCMNDGHQKMANGSPLDPLAAFQRAYMRSSGLFRPDMRHRPGRKTRPVVSVAAQRSPRCCSQTELADDTLFHQALRRRE